MAPTCENSSASKAQTHFSCSRCNFVFFCEDSLKKHLAEVHKELQEDPDKANKTSVHPSGDEFTCSLCNKTFNLKNTLNRHLIRAHKLPREEICPAKEKTRRPKGGKFSCTHCDKSFSCKFNLKRHWRDFHKQEYDDPHKAKMATCIQPNCDRVFYHRTRMLKHLEDDHNLVLSSSTHRFDTERDFLDWKEREERKNLVQFTKQGGSTLGKLSRYSYYICQHDGSDRAHCARGQPQRLSSRRNKKGRVKTGAICPARMLVKAELNSSVLRVTYVSSHNHEPRPRILSARSRRKCSRTTPWGTGKRKTRGKVAPGGRGIQSDHEIRATNPATIHTEGNDAAMLIATDLHNGDADSDTDFEAPSPEFSMLEETKGYLAELIGLIEDKRVQRTVLPQIHDMLKKTVDQCEAIKAQVHLFQPEPSAQREHDYFCI
eukprot:XP_002594876.1 hypothetical protein BRAFLDRAFT_86044 [Branchiostoma floridae]